MSDHLINKGFILLSFYFYINPSLTADTSAPLFKNTSLVFPLLGLYSSFVSFIHCYLFFLILYFGGITLSYYFSFVYGYVAWMYISVSCAHSAWRGEKKISETVEIVVIPGWVVGLEHRSSGKAASVLYHWSIFWSIFSNLPFLVLNLAFYNLLETEEICLIINVSLGHSFKFHALCYSFSVVFLY